MTNVLVLGANGKIAKLATVQLLNNPDNQLTLFLRKAQRLAGAAGPRVKVVEGDASQVADLTTAMTDVDVVYANLAGRNIEDEAQAVVTAMQASHVQRLIWISTLGIYDEVPGNYGKWNHQMLDGGYLETYAAAAKVIEASDLAYTIIRPAWLTDHDEINYETTQKGEPFKGTEVSRKSIAALVAKLVTDPTQAVRESLGVNKPNTDGDKPAWY
ncbi:SDR family oxidoreductase [Levilactobacillus brevis]|uniref:SDR family oxidoreductase n=1 Tax=Levilactobacillus brevis TaxID=1580 RepID=UPI0021A60B5E|nr:SDR family oxidoreductase [Levilactobacillus brevis]MCT2887149.1 SDR family oxidoreductase [Levilactobacillus brevis]MCT3587901.1 SDR family oxidoreductase [Levilactobacillus brevis]WAE44795.1 SDR family oxidoreductase [Levilactobacillus brevis]